MRNRVQSLACPRKNFGGPSGTEACFTPSTSEFPYQSPFKQCSVSIHVDIEMDNRPIVGRSTAEMQTDSTVEIEYKIMIIIIIVIIIINQ